MASRFTSLDNGKAVDVLSAPYKERWVLSTSSTHSSAIVLNCWSSKRRTVFHQLLSLCKKCPEYCYLEIAQWRSPWSFRVWRGKGHPSPAQLACKLLTTVPIALSQGTSVIVLADTEFGTVDFLTTVQKRSWRAIVGMRCNRKLADGRTLKQLYRQGQRGQQVEILGISYLLTVS